MNKQVIISTVEWMEQIRSTLRPRIGVVADVIELKDTMLALLDYFFHSEALATHVSLQSILEGFSIPSDIRHELSERLMDQVAILINRGFGAVIPSRSYTYRLFGQDSILLHESTNQIAPPLIKDEPTTLEQYLSGIEDGAGDYLPERLRRSLGC